MPDQKNNAQRRTFLKGAGAMAAAPLIGQVAGASGDEPDETASTNKRVVGYYPSWAGDYTPEDVPYEKITHLNYAFLEPKSDGTVKLAVTGDYEPELLETFREVSRRESDTSFLFSISSGWYSGRFSDAASTAERRERFARTTIELLREYEFDGVDIDWEYPDGTIRDTDPQNLTLLLAEIRRQLDEAEQTDGKTYELSMAASPVPSNIDPLEVGKISEHLDFVNVMNYNFHGGWSATTHFNAPLYASPDAPNTSEVLTADHAMRYWADQPISREKLVFGLPFYGTAFTEVQDEDRGLFQPFEGSGSEVYWNVRTNFRKKSHYEYYWHPDARVPWLYSPEDETFVSYDDRHSVMEKTKYVADNGFGGMMCWELSQDSSNTLLDAIHASLAKTR